ncbi:MAG TPA: response regulator [Verrucomicrobiae bacterium]
MQSADTNSFAPPATHILLIEDDPSLEEILAACLQGDNVKICNVRDGSQALLETEREDFDLILLDMGLPGMDGFDLLAQLKSDPKAQAIPVIALTAWQSTSDKVRGLELGAVDYITKPFELVELRARIRATLRSKRLQDDLTRANRELRASRLASEEAARAKSEFLASMSHEIRTPMNGVIAMTGLLLQTELTQEQKDFVETVRTSGESLLTIINDILNFSKIESGKLELEAHPFDIRLCLEEAMDLLATKAGEKNLDLAYEVDDQLPGQMLGDVTRLRQVVVNLLGNAIKFTSEGEVVLTLKAGPIASPGSNPEVAAWDLLFSVRDTGIGIPADRLNRLFRSFSQVDSSTARQYGGTGLGLAISKGLVELMGGKMWVESTMGKGSTFHFSLVLQAAASTSVPPSTRAHPQLAGLNILILDDNPTIRRVLHYHAQRWGAKPRAAESGQQALEWVREGEAFDLAIIERQMSRIDGGTVASEMRKLPIAQKLPIIFLTPVGVRAEGQSSSAPAITSYLTKPIKPAQLQAALLQFVSGAKPAPARVSTPSKLDPSMASRLPLRVLVTDDNVINQKVASRLLQQMGYRADVANNGLEAIHALERQPYDMILMDMQMPEMDGLEATRVIRQRQKEANSHPHFRRPIVIIAMTANAMQGDRETCIAAGMNDYVPKPIRPEMIQTAFERCASLLQRPATIPAAESTPLAAAAVEAKPPPLKLFATEKPQDPVDMERLLEFAGGNTESMQELIALYLKQTTLQLEAIRAALKAGNTVEAGRVAHSCAGASGTCGMTQIVPPLHALERICKHGDAAPAEAVFETAVQEFERVQSFFNKPKHPIPPTDILDIAL